MMRFGVVIVVSLLLVTGGAVISQSPEPTLELTFISDIDWSPDGLQIAVGLNSNLLGGCIRDARIQLYSVVDKVWTSIYRNDACALPSVSYSNDGQYLLLAGVGNLEKWNLAIGERVDAVGGPIAYRSVRWNPIDDRWLVTGSGAIEIFEDSLLNLTKAFLWRILGPEARFVYSEWDTKGDLVASSMDDGLIYVWDADSEETLVTFSVHEAAVRTLSWNPITSAIASGDDWGVLHIWNGLRGTTIQQLVGQRGAIRDVEWSPDGTQLAYADDDTVRVWNMETNTFKIVSSGTPIWSLAYSPDGSQIALGGEFTSADDLNLQIVDAPVFDLLITPTPTSNAQLLRDLLLSEDCVRACFMGIEPGVTTQEQVQEILRQQEVDFETFLIRDVGIEDAIYILTGNEASSPLDTSNPSVMFNDGIVSQILLPINTSLESFTHAFGAPQRISYDISSSYHLEYLSLGIVVPFTDLSQDVSGIYLTVDSHPFGGVIASDNVCSEYGIEPCFFPTATPQPMQVIERPTPNPDAQLLRDLLLSEDCVRACFMGIEPGVTIREEVEAILLQNNITYAYAVNPFDDSMSYTIYFPDNDFALFPFQDGYAAISILTNDQKIVTGVTLVGIEVPVEIAIEAIDENPKTIVVSPNGPLLLYPEIGIEFEVDERNPVNISTIYLSNSSSETNPFWKEFAGCSEAIALCSLVTATPHP